MKSFKYLFTALSIISLVLLVPSCAVNPVTGKKQLMFMSEEQEIAMGTNYDPQVIATFGLYDNETLQNFITNKVDEMGKLSHRPHLKYHVRILDSPVVNAFAVPGGYLYFTRGILGHFNCEAELMGVIAHEMGHVTARHTVSNQAKQTVVQLAVVGGMIASKDFAQFANEAMQGMQLLFLKFSRDNEREADRLGVEYSTKMGYDAHHMAEFFNVLDKMQMESDHAGVPTFMSTHPDPGDRYITVNKTADQWQDSIKLANYTVNSDSYLKMIDGLVYGEDPRQGYVEGNTFYHPEMEFSYPIPSGWTLVNSPMQVQMVSADQKALMLFSLAQEKTPQEAAQKAIESLKLEVTNSRNTSVNGLQAVVVDSKQTSQDQQTGQAQTIRVTSSFIEYNGAIYVFHGVSSDADFIANTQNFEHTMGNFNKLTDASKINVKPKTIEIKKVQRSGTLADAFSYYGVQQTAMKDLALLNNMELAEKVIPGKLIKIIR